MTAQLTIQSNFSLRAFNTFGIDANAQQYCRITSTEMLREAKQSDRLASLPRFILGGGSNIVLTKNFPGVVLHMCTRGISILHEDEHATYVRAAAGESWHELVLWTLAHGLAGLENLSLIPGSVGAAPIQNIGAYGAELKDCLHSVTVFDWATGEVLSLGKTDCRFAYRDSVFKHALRDRAIILDIVLALPKQWVPNLKYADVAQEIERRGIAAPNAKDISDAVIAIRSRKLPDPKHIGNAGSFFKNPVISADQRNALLEAYPQLVSYLQSDGSFKLAAGWMIEQCGWKGKSLGPAAVYQHQALVLTNQGGASGEDILKLAQQIQSDVSARFGVKLEAEPVYI